MLIDNEEDILKVQKEPVFESIVYTCNKTFRCRQFIRNNTNQIASKNYTSLIKVYVMIESLLPKDSKINVKEELEELYEAIGFDPKLYKNDKKKLISNPHKREICKEIVDICDSLNKFGKATIVKILERYNQIHHENPRSYGFIRKHLRMANYTFKKCSIKNPKIATKDYYYRKLYVIDVLTSKILNDYIVLSIDETPLNTNDKSRYFWSSNDTRDVYKKCLKKSGFNMIMAIGLDEIVYHRVYDKSNDGISFWSFVNDTLIVLEVIDKFKQRVKDGKVLLFLDNAGIHYRKKVRDQYLKYNVEILYNVPYESSFNPIELVFRCIKSNVIRHQLGTLEEIKDAYMLSIINVSSYEVLRAWRSSIKAMFKAIKVDN